MVTFIGASDGRIRDPTRKRLTGYTSDTRSNKKETDGIQRIRDPTKNYVNEYIVTCVDTISSESETYSETVWITRGSGGTFLCEARDLFGVVVRK